MALALGGRTDLRVVSPAALRAVIAHALAPPPEAFTRLGEITLAPHQVEGAARLRRILARHGGALLADDVGLGKTFTALAVARDAARVVVVAPAALREMWRAAGGRVGRDVTVVSYDRLSRAPALLPAADFVVADEAHHARNAATHRYASLARLTTGVPLLLLTATPVHNRETELRALLALFLGRRAYAASLDLLGECIVRRTASELARVHRLPVVGVAASLAIAHNEELLESLAALPPPLPPSDGGVARALLGLLLVRLWCSSDAALRAALGRLLARAAALTSALTHGRYPTRRELGAWRVDASGVQLAFPELVSRQELGAQDPAPLLASLDAHVAAVRAAQRCLTTGAGADGQRAAHLASLVGAPHEPIVVAFTQYEETARELFRRLRHVPHVALLSARGARTAAGAVRRAELLGAMGATGAAGATDRFAVRLLITTDLLSEGVDLSSASTLVHVDLPWTPARVRQRLGRLRRPGSRHREIAVHAFELPAPAARVTDIIRTLQEKARTSARLFGHDDLVEGVPLSRDALAATPRALSEGREVVARHLAAWRGHAGAGERRASGGVPVAFLRASGGEPWIALALVDEGHRERLAIVRPTGVSTGEEALAELLPAFDDGAETTAVPPNDGILAEVLDVLSPWMELTAGGFLAGVQGLPAGVAPVQRAVLRAVAALLRSLPRGERARLAPLAERARRAVVSCAGAGAELRLERVADELRAVGDVASARALLERVTALASATSADVRRMDVTSPRLLALLVVERR